MTPQTLQYLQLLTQHTDHLIDRITASQVSVLREQANSATNIQEDKAPRGLRRDSAPEWSDSLKRDPADFIVDFEAYAKFMNHPPQPWLVSGQEEPPCRWWWA